MKTVETTTSIPNSTNAVLAEVNDKVRGTDLSILEGKKMIIKRKGKRKSVLSFFGHDISIKNEMLNFC